MNIHHSSTHPRQPPLLCLWILIASAAFFLGGCDGNDEVVEEGTAEFDGEQAPEDVIELNMESYALNVERGQTNYFVRRGEYLDLEDRDAVHYAPDDPIWTEVLEFDEDVPEEISIAAEAGDSCDHVCANASDPSQQADHWFAVRIEHEALDEAIFLSSETDAPTSVDAHAISLD